MSWRYLKFCISFREENKWVTEPVNFKEHIRCITIMPNYHDNGRIICIPCVTNQFNQKKKKKRLVKEVQSSPFKINLPIYTKWMSNTIANLIKKKTYNKVHIHLPWKYSCFLNILIKILISSFNLFYYLSSWLSIWLP